MIENMIEGMATEVRKPYEESLNIYDKRAKKYIKIIMCGNGCNFLRENVYEATGEFLEGKWDVEFEKNGEIICVEGEIKDIENEGWWGEWVNWPWPFRWPDVQIPWRKRNNRGDYYFVISPDGKYFFVCKKEVLRNSPVGVVPNKKVRKGEKFFKVPCEKGLFYKKHSDGNYRIYKCK